MSPEVRSELQRLLSALCDGELTAGEHARLEELLASNPECRRLYLQYLDMHARLVVRPDVMEKDGSRREGTTRPVLASLVRNPFFRYSLVAAATLAASLLVQVLLWPGMPTGERPVSGPSRQPAYLATLTQAADCVWEVPGERWQVGSRLPPGEVRLAKGIARIRFDSGPELLVEGPAALHLESSTAAMVLRGKVVFKADETAAQFDLHTPSSTVLDLGTEYAVMVGPEGEEIHVFDGEVRRTARKEGAGQERLTAGEARRYGRLPDGTGQPTALAPERFVRQLAGAVQPPPDLAAGLLAYEGFDYQDPDLVDAGKAQGGLGWVGPWTPGFARPLNEGDQNQLALHVREGLVRAGAAAPSAGGSFDYTGFTKYFRRLAEPVRLDTDGVYYLSFLFRRYGPSDDPVNAVAVLLWTEDDLRAGKDERQNRLNIGVGGPNQLFTHLHRVGSRTPMPLSYGETYLLVAKIAAGGTGPDQVFMRVYAPLEPVEREEPGSWSVAGPLWKSDLVFDWLQLHINSKKRQTLDELRLGSTWASVTAPWIGMAKEDKR